MKNTINLNEPDYFNGPLCEPMDYALLEKYHIRALIKYCEEKNITADQLSDEELKSFERKQTSII